MKNKIFHPQIPCDLISFSKNFYEDKVFFQAIDPDCIIDASMQVESYLSALVSRIESEKKLVEKSLRWPV